jgi:hypothetical protein
VARSEQPARSRDGNDGGDNPEPDAAPKPPFVAPAPTDSFAYSPPQEGGGDGAASLPVFVYERGFLDDAECTALLTALEVRSLHVP